MKGQEILDKLLPMIRGWTAFQRCIKLHMIEDVVPADSEVTLLVTEHFEVCYLSRVFWYDRPDNGCCFRIEAK